MIARATTLAAAACLGVAACAVGPAYHEQTAPIHEALARGDVEAARAELDRQIAAAPGGPHAPLLLLERACVSLRAGLSDSAAADLAAADGRLEVLDLTEDTSGELGAWLYSESAAVYKAPPYEKLMVNVMGMAARLASGDLEGARVEARRLQVMDDYLDGAGEDPGGVRAASQYLAGLVFQLSGEPGASDRHYTRAAQLAEATPGVPMLGEGQAELVVVLMSGTAPRRTVQELSASQAAEIARGDSGAPFPVDVDRPVPVLALDGHPSGGVLPEVSIAGAAVLPVPLADVEATARATFRRARPALARASLTRVKLRRTLSKSTESKSTTTTGLLFGLIGSVAEASLEAQDIPDTRGWTTLPARIDIVRRAVPAGDLTLHAGRRVRIVRLAPGQRRVLVLAGPAQ